MQYMLLIHFEETGEVPSPEEARRWVRPMPPTTRR